MESVIRSALARTSVPEWSVFIAKPLERSEIRHTCTPKARDPEPTV